MGLVKRTYVDGETVITADNLNDIQDEIIQNALDISTKGTYSKPSGGIPASDLASGVQTSLGKADSALQSSDIDNTLTVSGKAADAKKTGDEISDVKNTLNHKADVIYDTASGDIASFPDGADGLPVKDLTVGIEPVQSGTGDPSPTNVRPISGWTGCNVTRTGKNLLEVTAQTTTVNDVTFTIADGVVTLSGTATNRAVLNITENFFLKAGTYRLSGSPQTLPINCYLNINGGGVSVAESSANKDVAFTLLEDATMNYVRLDIANGTNTDGLVFKPMIRLASVIDTAYEPYTGATIPISWQSEAGTVYGGTLDVTSGVLTVDRAMHTVGTSDSTRLFGALANCVRVGVVTSGAKEPTWDTQEELDIISNCAKTDSSPTHSSSAATADECCLYKDGSYVLAVFTVPTNSGASASAALQYLVNNGCAYCYPLATPQTYQLTPQEVITTLLGQNNIWTDCGPSTVEYSADTRIYVDNEIGEVENTLTQLSTDAFGSINLTGTNTTGSTITAGTFFYNNGSLVRAKTDIQNGSTITIGTNAKTVTAGGLNDLMDSLTPTYTQYKYSAESDTSVAANGISAEIPVSVDGTKGEVIGVVGVAPGNTLMGVVGFRKSGNTINVVVWNNTNSPRNCRPDVHVIQVLYQS